MQGDAKTAHRYLLLEELFFWLSRFSIVFLFLPHFSDVVRYFVYAKMLLIEGKLPYRNFDFEYTPLTYLLFLAPSALERLFGWGTILAYRRLFSLVILPFDFLLFRKFRGNREFPRAGAFYVLFTAFCWLFLYDRFDLLLGFCLCWTFLCSRRGPKSTARLWGLGAALKVFPLALAPLLWFRSGNWRSVLPALPAFLLSCAIAAALAGGPVSFLTWQASRGLQVESLAGGLAMAAKSFGHLGVDVEYNYGSNNITSLPGLTVAAKLLFWVALAGAYAGIWTDRRRRTLLTATWLMVSAFVTFGYVLSPQYLLWLIPLSLCVAAKLTGRRRALWLLALGLATAATGLLFLFFQDYVAAAPAVVALLLLRNLTLLALFALSWVWLREKKPGSPLA